MARFGQGLIQALTNPSYAADLNQVGMLAGSLPGRRREAEREELENERRRAAMMSAFQLGSAPGQSDPGAAMAAMSQGTGADPAKMVEMLAAGRALNPEKEALAGRDRFVTAGPNVFDMKTGQWRTPPTKEEVDTLKPTDAVRLYKNFTEDSVRAFLKDPSKPLKPLAKEKEGAQAPQNVTGKMLASDAVISTIDRALTTADEVWGGTYDLAQFIPLTNARSLNGLIKTIDSNLAFDRLQKMRDESKTGGALGQVSNIELGLLKSSVANLDPAAGGDMFIDNLKKVREQYNNFRRATLGLTPQSDRYKEYNNHVYYKDPDTGDWFDLGGIE